MTVSQGSPSGGGKQGAASQPPAPQPVGGMSSGGKNGTAATPPSPTLGGALGNAAQSAVSPVNQATLASMYGHMLGRAPDPSATSGWTGQSQADVIKGIQNSPEYQQLHGMQTTGGVPVNGQPVAQPGQMPINPNQSYIDAQSKAQGGLDALTDPANAYATGKMDYNTYASQMKDASGALGNSIADYVKNYQQPGAAQPTPFQQQVSGITPYGSQYRQGVASNPLYQTPQGQGALAAQQMGINMPQVNHAGRQLKQALGRGSPKMGRVSPQVPPQ